MGAPTHSPERRLPTGVELLHAADIAQLLADRTRLRMLVTPPRRRALGG